MVKFYRSFEILPLNCRFWLPPPILYHLTKKKRKIYFQGIEQTLTTQTKDRTNVKELASSCRS
uniref:Uncharacterized protein n=1 Tax=Arundo donax TaxID=35708 RepID=A0A0A9F8L4_ARUDO